MQVRETGVQQTDTKRVTVRTSGAGHAHSGVKAPQGFKKNGEAPDSQLKREYNKVVSLGG